MAVKKVQILTPDSNYVDVVHPETEDTMVQISDVNNHFNATKLDGVLDELFTNVSNGKVQVRDAITGKGGTVTDADGDGVPTFQELTDGVNTMALVNGAVKNFTVDASSTVNAGDFVTLSDGRVFPFVDKKSVTSILKNDFANLGVESNTINRLLNIGNNQVLYAYLDGSSFPVVALGTVNPSGFSVSFQTPVVIDGATNGSLSLCQLDVNKFLVVYSKGGQVYGSCLTLSGSTLTFSTPVVLYTATYPYSGNVNSCLIQVDTDTAFLSFVANSTSYLHTFCITASGTTLTAHSAMVLNNVYNFTFVAKIAPRVFTLFRYNSTSTQLEYSSYSVDATGNFSSIDVPSVFDSNACYGGDIAPIDNNNNFLLSYVNLNKNIVHRIINITSAGVISTISNVVTSSYTVDGEITVSSSLNSKYGTVAFPISSYSYITSCYFDGATLFVGGGYSVQSGNYTLKNDILSVSDDFALLATARYDGTANYNAYVFPVYYYDSKLGVAKTSASGNQSIDVYV